MRKCEKQGCPRGRRRWWGWRRRATSWRRRSNGRPSAWRRVPAWGLRGRRRRKGYLPASADASTANGCVIVAHAALKTFAPTTANRTRACCAIQKTAASMVFFAEVVVFATQLLCAHTTNDATSAVSAALIASARMGVCALIARTAGLQYIAAMEYRAITVSCAMGGSYVRRLHALRKCLMLATTAKCACHRHRVPPPAPKSASQRTCRHGPMLASCR